MLNNNPVRIRKGSVQGTKHKLRRINNQDKLMVHSRQIADRLYTFGVICDGMTGDKKESHSEVGARLLAEFAVAEIGLLAAAHVPVTEIPAALYSRMVGYVGNIARATCPGSPEELWHFIERNLLATVLGFISDGVDLLAFAAGDGVIIANEQVTVIDHDDHPLYLAYHQVDREILGGAAALLPSTFETISFRVADLRRFAIASDGLATQRAPDQSKTVEQIDLDALWDYESGAGAGLQWWLNKRQLEDQAFADDCTGIALGPGKGGLR